MYIKYENKTSNKTTTPIVTVPYNTIQVLHYITLQHKKKQTKKQNKPTQYTHYNANYTTAAQKIQDNEYNTNITTPPQKYNTTIRCNIPFLPLLLPVVQIDVSLNRHELMIHLSVNNHIPLSLKHNSLHYKHKVLLTTLEIRKTTHNTMYAYTANTTTPQYHTQHA